MVKGLNITNAQLKEFEGERCEPCILGKHSRDPFSKSVTNHPSQLVHLDVCGPCPECAKDLASALSMTAQISPSELYSSICVFTQAEEGVESSHHGRVPYIWEDNATLHLPGNAAV